MTPPSPACAHVLVCACVLLFPSVFALMRGCMQINIMSRLQYAMTIADTDKSGGLDFFEFIFLMFMMTQKGTYIDMVSSTHSKGERTRDVVSSRVGGGAKDVVL